MPKFSEVGKNQIFNSRYKNLIKILNKKKQNYFDEIFIDEIILTTYFSSPEINYKINKLNKKLYKFNSNSLAQNIFKKKKKFSEY